MPESGGGAEANASSPFSASAGASGSSPGNGKRPRGEPPGAATRVPFYKLFAFADKTGAALMLLGTLGAVANGAAMPFMTVLFGNLIYAMS